MIAVGPALLLHVRERVTTPFVPDWSIHPSVVLGTVLFGALYLWGIGPARRRWSLGPPVPAWRILCFLLGLVVLVVSLNGPIHDLSDDYLFLIHMAQHLLLTLLLPPLLLAGTPGWLLQPLVRHRAVRAVAYAVTRPLVAGAIFTVVFLAWHTVPLYDLMMQDHGIHILTHLLFIAAAVIMWWPVMSQVPELPPLPLPARMLYLFLVSLPMQLVAAIITFADTPLYQWYVQAPRTWGISPLDDQKFGGLLMWVPGNMWMFGAIAIIFFSWAREER